MNQSKTLNSTNTKNQLGTEKISILIQKFAVPAIISLLVNALYNMVDQIFIGHKIGTLGITATNVAFPLNTISTAVALLLGVGGASNFNLNLGRGNKEKASFIAGNSLSLLTILGSVIGLISFLFAQPLLMLFGATEASMVYALPYTIVIALGLPFLIFSTGACNFIRADGSPVYAMVCVLSGAVFNLIFDPIFLFVLDWGIEGIAWATTIGQIISSVIALIYLLKKFKSVPLKKQHLYPRLDNTKVIFSLGAAACFNQLAMTIVQVALNNTLKHYGALSVYGSEIPIACVGIISKINILYMSFTIGIAQGCQPINSFNYGAKNYDRVKQTYKTATIAVTIISTIAFLIFQIFPRQIISIFGPGNEDYFRFAIRYLRIYMFMTFLNGIQPVTSNFFTSIGKSKLGLWMSLTRQLLFLLPLILIFPLFLGIDGVMFTAPIADIAAAILAAIFIWREMKKMTELSQNEKSQPVSS